MPVTSANAPQPGTPKSGRITGSSSAPIKRIKPNPESRLTPIKNGSSEGSIIFINKNKRLTCDLNHEIRVVCMEEYEEITNIDEYIGFLYGIASSDHDIEVIFIDSILKHADIDVDNMGEFLDRLRLYSEKYEIELVVSISADKMALSGVLDQYELLN